MDGGAAGILRLDTAAEATVMGSWADHPGGRYAPGTMVPIRPVRDLELALEINGPVRVDAHPQDSPVKRLGYESSIVAPVHVSGCTWGVLAVTARLGTRLTAADELRLTAFGDLLATAIGAIEDRAKLAAQASSDPLTVADAWDVMTVSRPYSLQKTVEASLEECLALWVFSSPRPRWMLWWPCTGLGR